MIATRELPETYRCAAEIDPMRDKQHFNKMLLLSVLMLGLSVLFFGAVLYAARGEELALGASFSLQFAGMLLLFVKLLALMAVMVILHEGVHGAFFWFFTRHFPVFALRWTHAYAAAPGWYLPLRQYRVVCLAPLALVSLLCVVLLLVAPFGWLAAVMLLAVLNTSGAAGDVYVALWLRRWPPETLAHDSGDIFSVYTPAN